MIRTKIRVDWHGDIWLDAVEKKFGILEKATAEKVAKAAQALVPVDTGTLKQQIKVYPSKLLQSNKRRAGYLVIPQATGDYDKFYAGHVELGLHKTRNMAAQPYMRPAVKKNRAQFMSKVKAILKD